MAKLGQRKDLTNYRGNVKGTFTLVNTSNQLKG